MPVFRYDTRDVVRVLPDTPLTCEISGLPATSKVLGKADQILRLTRGRYTFYCTVSDHRERGMGGTLLVTKRRTAAR